VGSALLSGKFATRETVGGAGPSGQSERQQGDHPGRIWGVPCQSSLFWLTLRQLDCIYRCHWRSGRGFPAL